LEEKRASGNVCKKKEGEIRVGGIILSGIHLESFRAFQISSWLETMFFLFLDIPQMIESPVWTLGIGVFDIHETE